MNKDKYSSELSFHDGLAVIHTFHWLRRTYPDDVSTWDAVKSLISAGVVVSSSNKDKAVALCSALEALTDSQKQALEKMQFEEISRPAFQDSYWKKRKE